MNELLYRARLAWPNSALRRRWFPIFGRIIAAGHIAAGCFLLARSVPALLDTSAAQGYEPGPALAAFALWLVVVVAGCVLLLSGVVHWMELTAARRLRMVLAACGHLLSAVTFGFVFEHEAGAVAAGSAAVVVLDIVLLIVVGTSFDET